MKKELDIDVPFYILEVTSRKCVFHFNCAMTLFSSMNECKVISVKMQVDFQFNMSMNIIVSTRLKCDKRNENDFTGRPERGLFLVNVMLSNNNSDNCIQ